MSVEDEDFALDDHAQELLAALRSEEALPQPVHDRVWARVESAVAVAAPATPAASGVAAGWSTSKKVAAIGLATAAAAVAILAVSTPRSATRGTDASPPSQAAFGHEAPNDGGDAAERAASERPRRIGAEAEPAESPPGITPETSAGAAPPEATSANAPRPITSPPAAPLVEDPTSGTAVAPPEHAASPERRRPAQKAREAPSTLAEEIALLEKIRAALLADAPTRALDHVREHARRFPRGVLAQEREALRAVAMCTAGQSGGRAKAKSFTRAHPQSPLVAKVRAACSDEEKSDTP